MEHQENVIKLKEERKIDLIFKRHSSSFEELCLKKKKTIKRYLRIVQNLSTSHRQNLDMDHTY